MATAWEGMCRYWTTANHDGTIAATFRWFHHHDLFQQILACSVDCALARMARVVCRHTYCCSPLLAFLGTCHIAGKINHYG